MTLAVATNAQLTAIVSHAGVRPIGQPIVPVEERQHGLIAPVDGHGGGVVFRPGLGLVLGDHRQHLWGSSKAGISRDATRQVFDDLPMSMQLGDETFRGGHGML